MSKKEKEQTIEDNQTANLGNSSAQSAHVAGIQDTTDSPTPDSPQSTGSYKGNLTAELYRKRDGQSSSFDILPPSTGPDSDDFHQPLRSVLSLESYDKDDSPDKTSPVDKLYRSTSNDHDQERVPLLVKKMSKKEKEQTIEDNQTANLGNSSAQSAHVAGIQGTTDSPTPDSPHSTGSYTVNLTAKLYRKRDGQASSFDILPPSTGSDSDDFHQPLRSVLSKESYDKDDSPDKTSPVDKLYRSISNDHDQERVPLLELRGRDSIKFVNENEENHLEDIQNRAAIGEKSLSRGNITFKRYESDNHEQGKPFVILTPDKPLDAVFDVLEHSWKLRRPNVLLSVISNAEDYTPWKSQRLKDDFQRGIMKSANATSMWIITNGRDAGVTKMIGDAVREFEQQDSLTINQTVKQEKRQLRIIGIIQKENISDEVQEQISGWRGYEESYEFNADHSHFIILGGVAKDKPKESMRCELEQMFEKYGTARHIPEGIAESESDGDVSSRSMENTIPVVGLLVQGMPDSIDHILFYQTNKMPVLVLKGSGGLADIIAYAYEEMQENGGTDSDFEKDYLKPELDRMITRMYPTYIKDEKSKRNTVIDKIIESVKLSNGFVDRDYSYITVIDVNDSGARMKDLDKFILTAIFKTERNETLDKRKQLGDNLKNNLQLAVDWNRPDLAREILQHDFVKITISKEIFEQSLIQKAREDFIDLFLSQGVRMTSYLNPDRLEYLFKEAEDREFFVSVCLERIVGIIESEEGPLGNDFMPKNLNHVIYKLSNIQPSLKLEKDKNGADRFDPMMTERKVIYYIIMWAVLMKRQKIAKKLWNWCYDPIPVALICSRMYKELAKYTTERHWRSDLNENAKEFSEMALEVLDICWRDSPGKACKILGKHQPDFNNKTVIEIAHDAKDIHFFAHPCCQRWMTKKYQGHLQTKELKWGPLKIPCWIKILTSVFLVFPMRFWINFRTPMKRKSNEVLDQHANCWGHDESEVSDDEDGAEIGLKHKMGHWFKKVGQRLY